MHEINELLTELAVLGFNYKVETHPFQKNLYRVYYGGTQVHNGSYNMIISYLRGLITGLQVEDMRKPIYEG